MPVPGHSSCNTTIFQRYNLIVFLTNLRLLLIQRKGKDTIDQTVPHLSPPPPPPAPPAPSPFRARDTNCFGAPQRHQHSPMQNKKDLPPCEKKKMRLEKCQKLQNVSQMYLLGGKRTNQPPNLLPPQKTPQTSR